LHVSSREQWHKEQVVTMLYSNAVGAIIGSVSNITLVSVVLATIYPTLGLLSWFILGQALNIVRFYFYRLFLSNNTHFQTNIWLQIHRVLTFLSGCLYGALAMFFFSSEHPLYQMLVMLLSGGMGAAAVGTHSVDSTTFKLFLFSAVTPLIIRLLFEDTEVHYVLSAMLCLLLLVMLNAAKQTQKIMIDNIYMSQSLRYRATHDGLVDLLNREEFRKEFDASKASLQPSSNTMTSIIFIDLDNFKILNDTYGHQAGDDALIEIGQIIRTSIRKSDIAARFGGDEFMILIQSTCLEDATTIAEKILKKIDNFQKTIKETNTTLGASIGIGYSKLQDISYGQLLQKADQACYKAKNSGKGQICYKELKL